MKKEDELRLQLTMTGTVFFQCSCCRIECRIDFAEAGSRDTAHSVPLIVQHCPDSVGVSIAGNAASFQEKRGGIWVNVQRWIDAA